MASWPTGFGCNQLSWCDTHHICSSLWWKCVLEDDCYKITLDDLHQCLLMELVKYEDHHMWAAEPLRMWYSFRISKKLMTRAINQAKQDTENFNCHSTSRNKSYWNHGYRPRLYAGVRKKLRSAFRQRTSFGHYWQYDVVSFLNYDLRSHLCALQLCC